MRIVRLMTRGVVVPAASPVPVVMYLPVFALLITELLSAGEGVCPRVQVRELYFVEHVVDLVPDRGRRSTCGPSG